MTLGRRADRASGQSPPQLRECLGCGRFQIVPSLASGTTALCGRCATTLDRAHRHSRERSLALGLAALVLLIVMCLTTLMTVQKAGIVRYAGLFSGPEELVKRGMSILAVVVVFVTVVAPMARLIGVQYVLLRMREARPPGHLRQMFALAEKLAPWSMVEVFILGVFVAYVKLGDVVTIDVDTGVYALLALTFVMVWLDGTLDREAVWDALDGAKDRATAQAVLTGQTVVARAVGCETCRLVVLDHAHGARCPRCDATLHIRKPDSLPRTAALVIAAAVLYVPANVYPVLTVVQLGAGAPSTILGGVSELIVSQMYPLAALVFFASIAVPMLKLVGLSVMVLATWTGHEGWLTERTRLYHVVRWIGRWSMIDIFMEALLGALVQFGTVITIEPGAGAVAFCGVVVLTMLAAETFDPRTMWDAAEQRSRSAHTAGARMIHGG